MHTPPLPHRLQTGTDWTPRREIASSEVGVDLCQMSHGKHEDMKGYFNATMSLVHPLSPNTYTGKNDSVSVRR